MAPKENPKWVPTPVYPHFLYPTALVPIQLPQPQPDIDLDSDLDSDEYLGYPFYDNYIDSYTWLDFLPFNSFDYLNQIQILEGENIFGNLFGDPILEMDDFILEFPIPEDESIFGNLFGDYILGDENWDEELENNHSHGF